MSRSPRRLRLGPQARISSERVPDWEGLRALARQRIRARLRSAPAQTVADLAQEVLVTLFRLSRRERLLDPQSLVLSLVHRVCVDHVRRQKGPSGRLDAVAEHDPPVEPARVEAPSDMPTDLLELFRFLVLERFREMDAPCRELAERFYAEQSWSTVGEQLGLRHATVIKRWSRCMHQVRGLVRRQSGRLGDWVRSVDRG